MTTIRLAVPEDFDFFYHLKCEASNIFWTGHDKAPDYNGLKSFFEQAIEKQADKASRKIYIVMDDETPVGHIYIDPENETDFAYSMAISEKYWGHHYGRTAVMLAQEEGKRLGFSRIVGKIREDNTASIRAFTACGITFTGGASCEIGNTDFRLQPKGIFGCICKLTKLSGETPPGKA